MIDIVFWFERGRTDSAVARAFDGDRFHTGTGRDFLDAIADCVREYHGASMQTTGTITPGRQVCGECDGDGGEFDVDDFGYGEWLRCKACDGTGEVWQVGGPRFACPMELADRYPGEVVELGTGDRAVIAWHSPRKRPRERPETTFINLIDPFTDEVERNPIGVSSSLGVRSVSVKVAAPVLDQHDGEKDSDALDPFARRQREGEGPLL